VIAVASAAGLLDSFADILHVDGNSVPAAVCNQQGKPASFLPPIQGGQNQLQIWIAIGCN
jgi:hypothetical protein